MQDKLTRLLFSSVLIMMLMAVVSCKKDQQPELTIPPVPVARLEYFDLGDIIIKAGAAAFVLDVNHDGRKDLSFSTLLVGDPVNHVDKREFLVSSNIQVNLPVNMDEQIPVMDMNDLIVPEDFNGYQWFDLSSIVLIQKITSATQPPVWEGHWKNAVHKYLPYQVVTNNGRYIGWIELTVDIANERIILHKAAISKETGKVVRAGG